MKRLDDELVYRKMQDHLIIELLEMIAIASARSIKDIKLFVSRQSGIYKVLYATQSKDRPRQCVFGGTFNAMDTLPLDRTGNRRFMPVMIYPFIAVVTSGITVQEIMTEKSMWICLMWLLLHNKKENSFE